MNDANGATLRDFLAAPVGQKLLRGCAVSLRQWMKKNGISAYVSGCDDVDDVVGELVLMILEKEGLRQELEEAVAVGNSISLGSLISASFHRDVLDMRRSEQGSPWHALYRKTVRLLRQEDGVYVHGTRKGSFYTLADSSDPATLQPVSCPNIQDMQAWPPPTWDHGAPLRANLVRAARDLWLEATQRAGRHGLVAVRDVLGWLSSRGVVDLQPREALLESELPLQTPSSLENTPSPSTPVALEKVVLERMARRIVAGWKPEMVQSFHLVHNLELSQSEAAKVMGYASASGINYPLRQAVLNLREMIGSYPELSAEDGNEQDHELFLVCLLEACKAASPNF